MIGKKQNYSNPVPLFEVREMLKTRSTEGELSYEQSQTLEYAKKFAKTHGQKAEKLLEELKAVEGVDEKLAIKITDILPKDLEQLKLIVPKGSKISDAAFEEILKAVKKVQ